MMNKQPMAGEKWRLKRRPDRVVTVICVESDNRYVTLDIPWAKSYSGKAMDTFLKQYEKA